MPKIAKKGQKRTKWSKKVTELEILQDIIINFIIH